MNDKMSLFNFKKLRMVTRNFEMDDHQNFNTIKNTMNYIYDAMQNMMSPNQSDDSDEDISVNLSTPP